MREISPEELSKILKEHETWCDTDEYEGEKADLSGANMFTANLSGADLRGANLSDAYLYEADLHDANLSAANLFTANLCAANLEFAHLYDANLSCTYLSDAKLSDAELIYANLSGTNLSNANLSGANLKEADLSGADLSGANLWEATLSNADLSYADLAQVENLSINQLSLVKTLYEAELDPELMEQVKDEYPHLLGEIEPDEEKLSKRRVIILRSSYETLSVSQVHSMPNMSIRKKERWGFYGHSRINHDYNLKTVGGDKVVVDNATGLMWHQSGSDDWLSRDKANEWIKKLNKGSWLNKGGYAGYQDWRLPTLEEAASLLESSRKRRGCLAAGIKQEEWEDWEDLYIDMVFSKKQKAIWTGDRKDDSGATWYVSFYGNGSQVVWDDNRFFGFGGKCFFVRPVRSVE
jgi:hypothetical protein